MVANGAKKIAVTGGTGFVGKNLVRRLVSEGYQVRVLMRNLNEPHEFLAGVEFFQGDMSSSPNKLKEFLNGVDVLYHCAAEIYKSNLMFDTNVIGTGNLIRAAQNSISHWVQLSTVDVYGAHANGVIAEETQIAPVNTYEATKSEADRMVIEAAHKYGFSYSLIRPSKIYGLGMKNSVLYRVMSLISKGPFFFIGPPGASANYVHVDDVVGGLIACGTNLAAKNRTYLISDYCTLEELITIICGAVKTPYPRHRISVRLARFVAKITTLIPGSPLTNQRVNSMVKRAKYSMQRIENELGYKIQVPMKIGIRELALEWKNSKKKSHRLK